MSSGGVISIVERTASTIAPIDPARASRISTVLTSTLLGRPVARSRPRSSTISSGSNGAAGHCVLIDLALVHAGHWVEDAVYLERLHWHRPEALHGVKPVQTLAKFRKELGLPNTEGEDHGLLANTRRVLMAATTPAYLHREGNPKYVRAALNKLETLLPLVAK